MSNLPDNFDAMVIEELEEKGPPQPTEQRDELGVAERTQTLITRLSSISSQADLDSAMSSFIQMLEPSVMPIAVGDASRPHFEPRAGTNRISNSMYTRNRKNCIETLMARDPAHCTLTAETIFDHFQRKSPTNEALTLLNIPYAVRGFDDAPTLTNPITRDEVVARISHVNKTSAPGPSGISFADISNGPSIDFMVGLFNLILRRNLIPSMWKKAKLTMIFKSGDKSLPSSWRPIAGQETTEKIFAGIMADRLQSFVSRHNILPEWQRASSGTDGCSDCNLVLDMARDAAKSSHTQVHLMWIDIHNAFGSVDRELLLSILARFNLPATFIRLVESMYSDNVLRYDDGSSVRAIPEIVGVKQGDPLSPLLFSFYLAPAMLAVQHLNIGLNLPIRAFWASRHTLMTRFS